VIPCSWFENAEKKKKFISETTCYCKSNYSVNVSIFRLVEKELGFKKNEPKKRPILFLFFLDVNSVNSVEFT